MVNQHGFDATVKGCVIKEKMSLGAMEKGLLWVPPSVDGWRITPKRPRSCILSLPQVSHGILYLVPGGRISYWYLPSEIREAGRSRPEKSWWVCSISPHRNCQQWKLQCANVVESSWMFNEPAMNQSNLFLNINQRRSTMNLQWICKIWF